VCIEETGLGQARANGKVVLNMEQELTVSVKEIETPPALLMDVQGSMGSWQGLEVMSKIIESAAQKLLLVSMKNVDCINCAAVGKMLAMGYIAKELGKKLRFAAMQPYIRQAFELLGGHHLVRVYESEKDALAAGESQ
jgi:anti-anti-sigma regulatory factor